MLDDTKYLHCIICGAKYKGCRTCQDRVEYNPWRAVCDTPVHYQIYRVIQELNGNVITNGEAKEMLENINIGLAELDTLLPSVKSRLEILFVEKTAKKSKNIAKTEEIEDEITVPNVEKPVEIVE